MTARTAQVPYVEVVCGIHQGRGIWIPGYGWGCRYARGQTIHRASGIIIRAHQCHLCNNYWLMDARTPPDEQRCDNCRGPAVPSGKPSVWPQLNIVPDFIAA